MTEPTALTAGVLICTRNRLEPLLACLESVARQRYPVTQLIIVDGSDEPLESRPAFREAFAAHRFPKAELVYLHTRPGLTRQRNQGVARASTDVVFFLDDDVVLDPHYIATLMETFQVHPEYGGGMGNIAGSRPRANRPSDYLRRLFLLNQTAAAGRMQCSGLPTHPYGRQAFQQVEVLGGALMAYRLPVLREFAFDEAVAGYGYLEDVDFSYRVSRRYPLFYDPRAIVEHHHQPLPQSRVAENRRMYLVNHHYFFFKNLYPSGRWRLACYLWAVIGLFAQALLGGHGRALVGYSRGLGQIVRSRWRGRSVLDG